MTIPSKPPGYYTDKLFTCDDMDKAIQKEREECAKLCDYVYKNIVADDHIKNMAFKIRARGQDA